MTELLVREEVSIRCALNYNNKFVHASLVQSMKCYITAAADFQQRVLVVNIATVNVVETARECLQWTLLIDLGLGSMHTFVLLSPGST